MLYSDAEEQIFDAQRPTILNGIPTAATRPDLTERAIVLTLPLIRDEKRQTEAEFWCAFDRALPPILGALLTAVSTALAGVSMVSLTRKPRMVDFATWAVAAEPACPWPAGTLPPRIRRQPTKRD